MTLLDWCESGRYQITPDMSAEERAFRKLANTRFDIGQAQSLKEIIDILARWEYIREATSVVPEPKGDDLEPLKIQLDRALSYIQRCTEHPESLIEE